MSSVWFADISMESLPGPRPVRPTVSLRPSMACFRQQSARLVDMHALKPCARSCFSLPENLTSPRSTRMPAEPHYPLSFQKSQKGCQDDFIGERVHGGDGQARMREEHAGCAAVRT